MGRGIDNFYLILELDYLKPESDLTFIKNRIKEKNKLWNSNAEDRHQGAKYRMYKEQITLIGKVMEKESTRLAEAKDAEEFVNGILKEEQPFFEGKSEIEESAANYIMEKCGLWREQFEKVTGLKIVDSVRCSPNVDPNPKVEHHSTFQLLEKDLAIVKKKNLYDFLCGPGMSDWRQLQSLEGKELIKSYSNPKKEKHKYDRTETGTAVRTLCAHAEEIFLDNPEWKKDYDDYLKWQEKDNVIVRMVKYSGEAKRLDGRQADLFKKELTQTLRSVKDAELLFRQICAFKGISVKGAGEESSVRKVYCPECYAASDVTTGIRKCTKCGADLYMKCPKCKKEIEAVSEACGFCGFKLENVEKAEECCRMAQKFMDNMNFTAARQQLARAEQLFQGYDKLNDLTIRLREKEKIFSAEVNKLDELVKQKAYYQADMVLQELLKKAPLAEIAGKALIEDAVAEAERLYRTAVKKSGEGELLEICSQIARICPDYPGVETLVSKYPPQPAAQAAIRFDTVKCVNMLEWEKSPSPGELSYRVVRKESVAAANIRDADAVVLGDTGIPRFVDQKILPGIDYYYSIYTVRAGVSSAPVYVHGVNLSEPQIVSMEAGDGYVRAEWKPLGDDVQIEVWRGEGKEPSRRGEGVRISAGRNVFLDEKVENNRTYGYRVFAIYRVGGKDVCTNGTAFTAEPAAAPAPVKGLRITNIEADIFEAVWEYAGKEKIVLFCTAGQTPFQCGDTADVRKVYETLEPVEAVSASDGVCRFRIRDDRRYTIIPVLVKNNLAVIGEQAIVSKTGMIRVTQMKLINTELEISIEWPKDAIAVHAIYGTDHYAKSITDSTKKSRRIFTEHSYRERTALAIPDIERKTYYIMLYSEYQINGKRFFSEGTPVEYDNAPKADIRYSIRVKGLGIMGNRRVEMTFSCTKDNFTLPAIDIIAKNNGVPVYPDSGYQVAHIEERNVQGVYTETFETRTLPKGSCIKPFFSDADMYDRLNLRPEVGTQFKIN